MDLDESAPLEKRLEAIERQLNRVTTRLEDIERKLHIADEELAQPKAVVPPPPVSMWLQPPTPTAAPQEPLVPKSPQVQPPAAHRAEDLEYKIGMTGLLRGGSVVVVVGILYLVGLAISRGYITPQMQFIGELALCVAFIGFGLLKRNVREEFGQLMLGIGSSGLYLTFAGGHVYKHLYNGETLIGLFMALSFANLGFALWRSSRSFLALGLIGGLVAAMLPMRDHNVRLDVILHLLILVPSALIVARNRWPGMGILLWTASAIALVPAYSYDGLWTWRLAAVYASTVICAAAYGLAYQESDFDPWCAFVSFIAIFGGLAGIGLNPSQVNGFHVLILAGAILGLATLLKGRPIAKSATVFGAVATAVAVAPMGFIPIQSCYAYAALAVLLGVAAAWIAPKASSRLAWTEFVLALAAYTIAVWLNPPAHLTPWVEAGLLAALMVAVASAAFGTIKAGLGPETSIMIGGLIVFPIFWRFGFSAADLKTDHPLYALAVIAPILVFATVGMTVAALKRWSSLLGLGWATLALAMVCYLQLTDASPMAPMLDAAIVLSVIAAIVYGTFAIGCCTKDLSQSGFDLMIGIPGFILEAFLIRLAVVLLAAPFGPIKTISALAIGCLVATALNGLVYLSLKWRAGITLAWVSLFATCTAVMLIGESKELGSSWEVALLAIALAEIIFVVLTTLRATKERALLYSAGVVLFWVVYSRLMFVLLTAPAIGLKGAAAMTASWIVYATGLIAMGFAFRARHLRYWSLIIFGATIFKVFLMDLVDLDAGIRVVILLGLGLCMVGGGYWYIRLRESMRTGDDAARLGKSL